MRPSRCYAQGNEHERELAHWMESLDSAKEK